MLGRAVVWLCRTPQRLAGSVVVLLAVVLLGGGALFGGFGSAPSRPAPSGLPQPTAAQVPDAAPYVTAALSFVHAWSALKPDESATQWQDAVTPLATAQFAAQLRTIDPATLPGVQAQGEPVVRFVANSSALIAVPLADGSSVLVSVVSDSSGQKVSNVQPDVGN